MAQAKKNVSATPDNSGSAATEAIVPVETTDIAPTVTKDIAPLATPVSPHKNVIIAGDIVVNWNIARLEPSAARKSAAAWHPYSVFTSPHRGGASLLGEILAKVKEAAPDWQAIELHVPTLADGWQLASESLYTRAYSVWEKFPNKPEKGQKEQTHAWGVKEFLGLQKDAEFTEPELQQKEAESAETERQRNTLEYDTFPKVDAPAILVIDEENQGYRMDPENLPTALTTKADESVKNLWVVCKAMNPLFNRSDQNAVNPMLDYLLTKVSNRLILIFNVNDLRCEDVRIAHAVSWEKAAQDIREVLEKAEAAHRLKTGVRVIVLLPMAGAVLYSSEKTTLFYDPNVVEGEWEQDYPGKMFGYTTCMTASVASALIDCLAGGGAISDALEECLRQGICCGLEATRTLHAAGYGDPEKNKEKIEFPYGKVVAAIRGEKTKTDTPSAVASSQITPTDNKANIETANVETECTPFKQVVVKEAADWMILNDCAEGKTEDIVKAIIEKGVSCLADDFGIPIASFKNLIVADRQEIEGYRVIDNVICEYCNQTSEKPLSIAVFGPPGSGKSFGIKEIATASRHSNIKKLEFNLSQFHEPDQLRDAFHRVRDVRLSGRIPLVFWDEFDTNLEGPLGWLRYFLAPMQDGEFQDGQITHPIGSCIFVFAGGASRTLKEFIGENGKEFKDAKGNDFKSRLRGFIDISGINPPEGSVEAELTASQCIRRAMLLRAYLERHAKDIFTYEGDKPRICHITDAVRDAFINVSEYLHEARSMEAIIMMSQLTDKYEFTPSCLPTWRQLELHTNKDSTLINLVRNNNVQS